MKNRIVLPLCMATALCVGQTPIERPFGLLRPTPERYQSYPVTALPPSGVLPAKISLEAYLPPAGDQGNQGSCTAWATAYALRTAIQARVNTMWRPLDLTSRQFSPSFVYNTVKAAAGGVSNCTGGIYFDSALDLMQRTGAVTIDQFPYDPGGCTKSATPAQLTQARNYRIASWFKLPDLSTATMKTQLANEDPVLVGVDVYDSFIQASSSAAIKGKAGPLRGYHAIVLVGYDDDRNAFELQNSWGAAWGDNGRAWIDYDTLGEVAHEAYRVVPVTPAALFEVTERFGIVNDLVAPKNAALTLTGILTKSAEPFGDVLDTSRNYAVMVNAFASKAQAILLARSIAEGPSGLDAKIETKTVNNQPEYLVVVGADLSALEADVVLQRALRLGYRHAATIPMK